MNPDPISILQTAADLAAKAHAGQTIRISEVPYISHPVKVSMVVACLFGCADPEVAAAALLHDVLEKTTLTADEIHDALGPRVLHLVQALTKEEGGDKAVYWKSLREEVWEARLIKMADALDHLDCPAEELPRRIKGARRALKLATSDEEPILNARRVLEAAVVGAAIRLGALV